MGRGTDHYCQSIRTEGNAVRVAPGPVLSRYVAGGFYAEYSSGYDLASLDESVLAVPFVLATAPIIWCAGTHAELERLDATVTESLIGLRAQYAAMYPSVHWTGRIDVQTPISNTAHGGPMGLLFSGGLDCIHTAMTIPGQKLLFTVWGADTNPDDDTLWNQIKGETLRFAERFGHIPVFVRSNFRSFLRERLHTWHAEMPHWYGYVQHGPGLLGLTAPVMMLAGGQQVAISSGYVRHAGVGWGSTPELDESVRFGDVAALSACPHKNRQEKTRDLVAIRRKNPSEELVLRVCLSQRKRRTLNCGICEKCLRTATGLILEGEDPRLWGFPKDPLETLKLVRLKMQRYSLTMREGEVINWGRLIEQAQQVSLSADLQRYVDWLGLQDIDKQATRHQLLSGRRLYARGPRPVRRLIRRTYLTFRRSG